MALEKAATSIVASLTLAASCQVGCARAQTPCHWDDTYYSVIEASPAFSRSDRAADARSELRRFAEWMGRLPERIRFRGLMQASRGLEEQVLLELVTPVNDQYTAVWVHRKLGQPASLLALTRSSVREAAVSEESWQQIGRLLRSERLRGGFSVKATDGPAFFVSWAHHGACGQYAIYAPIFSSIMPDYEREYQNAIAPEKEVVEILLRLTRQARPAS